MIRAGTGGWVYGPWRSRFYPSNLPHKQELEYASRRLTAIEINATFHRLQSPSSFAEWREATPPGFVFSVKAPRFATHRTRLSEAAPAIERFLASGIGELGPKLGPIVWQFAHNKRFDRDDFAGFLRLLPARCAGATLCHAVDARHPSFACKPFVDLAREHHVAIVVNDSDEHPMIADVSADFVYLRLMRSVSRLRTGYAARDLDMWADRARSWARGSVPADLPRLARLPRRRARDVFVYFIAGAKERAPAAALELIARL